MIRLENITKVLDGKTILDGVSLHVQKGELFVITGASGSGKTVTLKLISRLMLPDSGAIYIDGDCITEANRMKVAEIRRKMGYLFQSGALLAWLNLYENIALPLRENTPFNEDEIEARVMEMLGLVGLENDAEKFPAEISGGMCKRAGLARALVMRPQFVLFDEPTSGLDPIMSRQIDALVRKLTSELQMSSVVVTHDLRGALEYADRITLLHKGKFLDPTAPAQFHQSQEPEVQNFLKAQFII